MGRAVIVTVTMFAMATTTTTTISVATPHTRTALDWNGIIDVLLSECDLAYCPK